MKTIVITGLILSAFSGVLTTGKATYYGQHWTGRLTASGERFHADSLTCAHKTLPFGTLLEVTDLNTKQKLTVKVNDRLPKSSGVLIDLTYGTAKKFGMLKKGVIKVSIEKVGTRKIYKK
jgi:rare lipoprotein A